MPESIAVITRDANSLWGAVAKQDLVTVLLQEESDR
jgi:hypothetical protein